MSEKNARNALRDVALYSGGRAVYDEALRAVWKAVAECRCRTVVPVDAGNPPAVRSAIVLLRLDGYRVFGPYESRTGDGDDLHVSWEPVDVIGEGAPWADSPLT